MSKIINFNEDWEQHDGAEVQAFIKEQFNGKAGYFIIDSGYLYIFATQDDYQHWVENPDDKYLVCPKVQLPVGGDTQNDALAIYSIDSTQYYTKGAEKIRLRFKVRNIVDGAESTDIVVNIKNASGASMYNATRPAADAEGYYNVTLEGSNFKNIANASENIYLTVSRAGEDRSVSRTISIHCVDLGLALYSGYNFGIINPSSISYVPTFNLPSGMTNIKLVIDVYRSETVVFKHYETSSFTTNNRVNVPLSWSDLPFTGVYNVKAHLDMGGGLIQSPVVETNLMCVKEGEEAYTALVAIEPIGEVTLYDDIRPRIAVFYKGEESADVKIKLNNGAETRLTIPCNRVYSEYVTPVEEANNTLVAQILNEQGEAAAGAVENFTASGSFDWKTITGYTHNLSAKGRTNDEKPTPANWGGVTTFEDFAWNSYGSGWKDNALHLTGGSKATINITPFYSTTQFDEGRLRGGGILDTGRTFRIRFKASNVSDTTKKIIQCWDGNVGFFVTADTIYVRMGANGEITTDPIKDAQASQNNRHYSACEEVELCITVQPYWDEGGQMTKRFVTMYINGQFAGEAMLSNTTLRQETALPVTCVADGCDLDVYLVTTYNKCLDSFEVLQNYVMGMGSLVSMKYEFNKNQCYTGNGIVSYNETFKYCKNLSAKLGDTIDGTCNIIVNTHTFDPSINDTDTYPTGKQELSLLFFRNGECDESRTIKYVGEKSKDLRVRIQGTSTASEYRKNMRYDCKGTVKVFRWSKELYEAQGGNNPDDGWYDTGETLTKLKIFLRGDKNTENACSLLTVKTNYNESTATRNLPMAKWTDDAMRYLAQQKDADGEPLFPQLLTPPQRSDSKVRQCIDGLPAVQFTHSVDAQDYHFSGKVDLITDKKNSAVFGFQKDSRDYSVEFRNGDTDICNFRCPSLIKAGKFMDSSFNDKGQDCLEYRWPDLDTGDVYYGDSIVCENSAIQRLFDFVFNCHPDFVGYKSKNGIISTTNSVITIKGENRIDNKTYREQKFYAEIGNYMVKDSIAFNAFVTKVLLWTDQRAKNQFFTHFVGDEVVSDYTDEMNVKGQTYEILRLLPYDIDTSLRGDNASRLRYDFTRLYTDADVYNDGVSEITISKEFYATQSAITDADTFIANRVMRKRSALFELMDATFKTEYAKMFDLLAAGFLNVEVLKRYCITNEADAFNSVIYNADTNYKYVSSGSSGDQKKAHGSAKEDLLWWAEGRMYFMGGENSAGDYTNESIRGTMCQDSQLDATNRLKRIPTGSDGIKLRIKSRYRNYIGTKLGSTGPLRKNYAETPHEFFEVTLITSGVNNEDSGRFRLYGQKFFEDIEDLSHLYISVITDWAGCTSMKRLKFGSDEAGFKNPVLTDIKGSGNPTFGACEVVDLRNCTAYSDSDFRCFPNAKQILLTGCDSLTELRLPVTDNLEVLALPAHVEKLEIIDKTKITSMPCQNGADIKSIYVENVSEGVVDSVLALLYNLYK